MLKGEFVFQRLLDEICLTYSPPSINSNELWTITQVESLQLFYLLLSTDDCTHNVYNLPQR